MSLLTADEITSMRDTADDALSGTAELQRKQTASDSGGGKTTTWATYATVAARLAPGSPLRDAEPITGERISPDSIWIVTLPAGTDITPADRILIGGKTLGVSEVADRTQEISRRVTAREIV